MIQSVIGVIFSLLGLIAIPVSDVEELLLNSSYTVETTDGRGTGFVVDGGFVVTAAHVVEEDRIVLLKATPPSLESVRAEVIYVDKSTDLAIVRPIFKVSGEPLKLAITEPKVGETVFTVGSALGAGTLSRGSIDTPLSSDGYVVARLPIEQGYSGGALVNSDGEVVGVVVAMAVEEPGVSYSVPSAVLDAALKDQLAEEHPISTESPEPTDSKKDNSETLYVPQENTWGIVIAIFSGLAVTTSAVIGYRLIPRRRYTTSQDKIVITLDNEG